MVGAVEAVVTMTMAAAPGMAMAVVTVSPAVGVTHTHLAVASEWAGRRGARLPLSREATLLAIRTAAQVAEGHVAGEAAIGPIEGWLAADTETGLGKTRSSKPWSRCTANECCGRDLTTRQVSHV